MNEITYGLTSTQQDLLGIIDLQKANLPVNITTEEKQLQGFVTVVHALEDLQKLHRIAPHIIARSGEQVVGYVLAMTAASARDIPVLVPMFELFGQITYHGKPVADYRYMVVGQVCVDKHFRGRGVFDRCYQTYCERFAPDYDFAITEIDVENTRSLKAHARLGFKEIHRYQAPNGVNWSIVLWEWRV